MPNWCFNKVAFVSKDKSKVEQIRNIITEGKKHPKIANDWTDWKLVFSDGSEKVFNIETLLSENEKLSRFSRITNVDKIENSENAQFIIELNSAIDGTKQTILTNLYPKGTNLVANDDSLVNAILHLTNLSNEKADEIVGNARGYILDIGEVRPFFEEFFFELTCDSAWTPADSFEEAIKAYDGVDVSIASEECGSEIYSIHDNHGIYNYDFVVDTDIPEFDECDCYFEYSDDIIEFAKNELKDKYDLSDVKNTGDLEELLNNDDQFFYVHAFSRD